MSAPQPSVPAFVLVHATLAVGSLITLFVVGRLSWGYMGTSVLLAALATVGMMWWAKRVVPHTKQWPVAHRQQLSMWGSASVLVGLYALWWCWNNATRALDDALTTYQPNTNKIHAVLQHVGVVDEWRVVAGVLVAATVLFATGTLLVFGPKRARHATSGALCMWVAVATMIFVLGRAYELSQTVAQLIAQT